METKDDILKAVDFMELNLKEQLNMSEVASYSGYSKYHFTRVFKEATGYTPSEYYRGRKLTEAIKFMQENKCKVIDAAFEYGFNSPEVFTRSCLSAFGSSPSGIKKSLTGNGFKGISPLTREQLYVNDEISTLNIHTETLPSLVLKGYTYNSPVFLNTLDLTNPVLRDLAMNQSTLYHLHWANSDGTFSHILGVPVDFSQIDDEDFNKYVYKKIPEGTYLTVPMIDSSPIEMLEDFVYKHLLVKKGYSSNKTYAVQVIKQETSTTGLSSLLYIPAI